MRPLLIKYMTLDEFIAADKEEKSWFKRFYIPRLNLIKTGSEVDVVSFITLY